MESGWSTWVNLFDSHLPYVSFETLPSLSIGNKALHHSWLLTCQDYEMRSKTVSTCQISPSQFASSLFEPSQLHESTTELFRVVSQCPRNWMKRFFLKADEYTPPIGYLEECARLDLMRAWALLVVYGLQRSR